MSPGSLATMQAEQLPPPTHPPACASPLRARAWSLQHAFLSLTVSLGMRAAREAAARLGVRDPLTETHSPGAVQGLSVDCGLCNLHSSQGGCSGLSHL